jgi:DNA-binding CsgD family transcriptional regulator
MLRIHWLYILVFFSWIKELTAQHTPAMVNYKVSEYRAQNQNWAATQAENGFMYFANTGGLLEFNGMGWELYTLPDKKIVRSVCAVGDKIYTGAYGEFGYWSAGACGRREYHSLNHKINIPAFKQEEIWHIVSVGNLVYFQSFSLLLVYDGNNVRQISMPGSIMFLHPVDDRLIIQSLGFGLFEIRETGQAIFLKGSEMFAEKTVTGLTKNPTNIHSDSWLVATNIHGVFTFEKGRTAIWKPALNPFFIDIQINKMHYNPDGYLTLASIRDGALIFGPDGQFLYHLHTENGLQNNTVLGIADDRKGNIWLGLDRGICLVKLSDDVLYYSDYIGKLGTVYTMARHKGNFYVGTNQGVYVHENFTEKDKSYTSGFSLVKGTQGQVWQLQVFKDVLLCGHNEGTFVIEGKGARKISDVTGGWYMDMPDEKYGSCRDCLIQGTYTGLVVFRYQHGTWVFSHKINGFQAPVKKFLFLDKQLMWVTGPNNGLTTLTINKEFKRVEKLEKSGLQQGIAADGNPEIHTFQGENICWNGTQYFTYNKNEKTLQKHAWLNSLGNSFALRQAGGPFWFRLHQDSLVFMQNASALRSYPFSAGRDYHSLMLLSDNQYGVCLSEGYAVVNTTQRGPLPKVSEMTPFRLENEDGSSCRLISPGESIVISHNQRESRLYFYHTDYLTSRDYFFRIRPLQTGWKKMQDPDFIDFSQWPAGNFTLEIKDSQHSKTVMDVVIRPPWYLSNVAIWLYAIFIMILLYWLKIYVENRLTRERKAIELENERILREHKMEMENDRLTRDNLIKSQELANATMHLIQKNELLQEIRAELTDIRKSRDHTFKEKDFQVIMKQINTNLTIQEDQKLFDASFNEVHDTFTKKLKKQFPDLSAADLRLAAYLKMNLSTKEIAPLFNISLRGLENKRYRLRKKLGLENDENIVDFLALYD